MNVLFIFPKSNPDSADFCPIGILYVAAYLKHKHNVQIIDDQLEQNDQNTFINKIRQINPDVIGISCNTLQVIETYRLADIIKTEFRNIKIIVGGPHPTVKYDEMFDQCKSIDYCVIGEGEQTTLELLDTISQNNDLHAVNGIAFREGEVIIKTKNRDFITDLDMIPLPAYELVNPKQYNGFPIMSALLSRGCPFSCIFCSNNVFGRGNRRRSLENIISEIEFIISKYDCKAIHFWDDTFNLKPDAVAEFCDELINRGIHNKIKWACEARVSEKLINLDLLNKMKDAGCVLISFGIESGNQKVLDIIRKRTTVKEIERAIKLTNSAGIKTRGLFMIGNLGENVESVFDSINLAKRLPFDSTQFTVCTPIPGSDFYDIAREKNWIQSYDYSIYTQKDPTVNIEDLNASQMVALKNIADFVMLVSGNDIDIFSNLLTFEDKRINKKGAGPLKQITHRLFHIKYPLKTSHYFFKYLDYNLRNYFRRN